MDVERVADGLWRWTAAHEIHGVYYEAPDAVVLFDPPVPAGDEERFFAYLDRDVERLDLSVSILLTTPRHERGAPILRERYGATDRIPDTVEAYPVEEEIAYFIRPHKALVVAARNARPAVELPVERELALG